MDYLDTRSRESRLEAEYAQSESEYQKLVALQATFASQSGATELSKKVEKIHQKWSDASIMSAVMLNEYTKGSDYINPKVVISNISLDPGKKLPSGLSLGTVNITLSADSIDRMVEYLTYLTTNSPYIFTLDTIDLPISAPSQRETGTIGISVALGVYYYE